MPNKSKTKGKSFENQVCKIMESIFGGSFLRCFTSGAYTGGKNFTRLARLTKNQIQMNRGDIVPDDSMSNMIIECKSYKDFAFNLFVDTKSNTLLDGWLKQVETDVTGSEFYFIVFKINNKGIFGVFREDLISDCEIPGNYSVYHYNNKKYLVMNFQDFMSVNRDKIRDKSKGE